MTCVPYIDQTACQAFIEWINSVREFVEVSLVVPEGKSVKNEMNHVILKVIT